MAGGMRACVHAMPQRAMWRIFGGRVMAGLCDAAEWMGSGVDGARLREEGMRAGGRPSRGCARECGDEVAGWASSISSIWTSSAGQQHEQHLDEVTRRLADDELGHEWPTSVPAP